MSTPRRCDTRYVWVRGQKQFGPPPAPEIAMRDFRTLETDLANSAFEFLMIDLDLALTFMNVADTSRVEKTVKRNHKYAQKTLESVQRFLKKLKLDTRQRISIDSKIAELEARLCGQSSNGKDRTRIPGGSGGLRAALRVAPV